MSDVSQRFGDVLVSLGFVTRSQVQEALALQHLTGHRVGEALLSLGYITRAQLQRALSHALSAGNRVALDRPPLGEILVGLKYLEEPVLSSALEEQRQDGRRLGEVLVEQGLVTHQQIYEALGLQQRMMAQPDEVEAAPPETRDGLRGVRVMVVDDSTLACNLVEQGLSILGYEVQSWQDPFLALEAVGTFKPNIVLTDLEMPGIDGAELCRRLKLGPSRALPVMILTANDEDVQRVGGLRAGADDYIHKGVSMDELAARMENILKRTNETDRIRRLFARYTSDAVVEEILKSGEVVLSGEKRDVTVLFADIRNFTSIAETYPPEQVMGLLNGVLGRLTDAVLAHGGTLDKFLGDGVMAVFGAPVAHDDDAARAVRAALQMMEAVREQNISGEHVAPLELGIGINTGLVVAGSVGSARRTEYTCIGDAVNIAARLCSLAGGGEILVGASTAERAARAGWTSELLPPVRLKGKAQPVPLYRVTIPRSADFS
ncbi:MAG: Adenylate cyclase [Myxococcaceae bacterium]|nr:Adenylate cyclase [Myxococcaceae bacterium]